VKSKSTLSVSTTALHNSIHLTIIGIRNCNAFDTFLVLIHLVSALIEKIIDVVIVHFY